VNYSLKRWLVAAKKPLDLDRRIPGYIQREVVEILDLLDQGFGEGEVRANYPEVIAWFQQRFPLSEVMASYGAELRPLCAERPDILIGVCPDCGGKVAVR
jgi:hypothetical protein